MTTAPKKTAFRMVRWFRRLTENNKPAYRWYEVDHRGL
jgi:hypothetical protein